MKQLLYVSSSKQPMPDEELIKILEKARAHNRAKNITGILLYHKNYFIQLLEGEEQDINELYASIIKDNRHHQINLIGRYDTPTRSFGEWSMAFKRISDKDISRIEGFSDVFIRQDGKSELLKKPTILVQMLATLFEINS